MISKLSIICLLMMFSEISSDNFCQEFRQNRDRIQYSFRRDFKPKDATITKSFLVINGKCWAIDFKHDPKGAKPTLTLDNQSKDCPIFTADHTFGLCLNTKRFAKGSERYCDAYLFNMDSAKGVIGQIPDDKHDDYKELSEYKVKSDLTISGHESAKSFVSVFQSDKEKTKALLIFVRISGQKMNAKLFDFDAKENELSLKEGDHTKVYEEFPVLSGSDMHINELLVLIYQFNAFIDEKDKGNGWGFILLQKKGFLDGKVLWCWTPVLKYNCSPQVLVDCSSVPGITEPSATAEGDEEEKGGPWMFVVIGIVVVVVVIAIIGCVVFFMKCRSKEEPEAASAQVSASAVGDAGAHSKRSQDVTSTAPNASAVGSKAGATTPSTSKASATPSGQPAKAASPPKASPPKASPPKANPKKEMAKSETFIPESNIDLSKPQPIDRNSSVDSAQEGRLENQALRKQKRLKK